MVYILVMFEGETRKRTVCVPKALQDVTGADEDSGQQVLAELKV